MAQLVKQDHKIDFHQRFLDAFTTKQLEDIVNYATFVGKNCIVIVTEDYFFELSADIGDRLDIYCESNKDNKSIPLTKEEFLELYRSSPIAKVEHMCIDE
jgi:hypothetical protein